MNNIIEKMSDEKYPEQVSEPNKGILNYNVISQYPDEVVDGESCTFTTIEMIARHIEDYDASYIGDIKERLSSKYNRDINVISQCIEHGLSSGLLVEKSGIIKIYI